jgi:hypothetical protein
MSDALILQLSIAAWCRRAARVLDLGCGDGACWTFCSAARLQRLRHRAGRRQRAGLRAARRQRHPAQPGRGPGAVRRPSFDVVLQIDTLQHLRNTEVMLRETARVGRLGIVSFPNFAHWPNRLRVLRGRMPVTCGAALPVVRHAQHPRRHRTPTPPGRQPPAAWPSARTSHSRWPAPCWPSCRPATGRCGKGRSGSRRARHRPATRRDRVRWHRAHVLRQRPARPGDRYRLEP